VPPSFRVYHSLEEVGPEFGPCALTIGNFDGVHIGHREILRRVVRRGREQGWKPSGMMFHPHPAKVVAPDRAPRLLSTPAERTEWMRTEGIEQVLILPFTPEFSCLSPEEFCRRVLAGRLGAKAVMIGWNFRFGRGQAGDTARLRELGARYGFVTEIVAGVQCRGRVVSSSAIRELLAAGKISLANRFLGREFAISGAVVPGAGVGSAKTVPTLNLRTGAEMLPAIGVYITWTRDLDTGVRWPSVTNVGYRPTFKGENLTIETHLLEPLRGAPPQRIRVAFLKRVREERKFPDADSLKAQILRDIARSRTYFRWVGRWVGDAARHSPAAGRGS